MLNQQQRRTGRGVGVRRLEHVNFVSPDVRACRRFLEEGLGYRSLEIIELDDGREYGAWLSATIQGHEIIYILERLPARGRLHHAAFWVDTREEVLRAADLFQDNGIFIEAGPAKHTPIHSFYLYVYEPGGNRVEVTSGATSCSTPRRRSRRSGASSSTRPRARGAAAFRHRSTRTRRHRSKKGVWGEYQR